MPFPNAISKSNQRHQTEQWTWKEGRPSVDPLNHVLYAPAGFDRVTLGAKLHESYHIKWTEREAKYGKTEWNAAEDGRIQSMARQYDPVGSRVLQDHLYPSLMPQHTTRMASMPPTPQTRYQASTLAAACAPYYHEEWLAVMVEQGHLDRGTAAILESAIDRMVACCDDPDSVVPVAKLLKSFDPGKPPEPPAPVSSPSTGDATDGDPEDDEDDSQADQEDGDEGDEDPPEADRPVLDEPRPRKKKPPKTKANVDDPGDEDGEIQDGDEEVEPTPHEDEGQLTPEEVKKPGESYADKLRSVDPAPMEIKRLRLDRQLRVTTRDAKTGEFGGLWRPDQTLPGGNGMAFRDKRRKLTGTILIDASGSMGSAMDVVSRIVASSSAITVAVYSQKRTTNTEGWLIIVGENGRIPSTAEKDLRSLLGSSNVCDLPAVRWLARQKGPRIWVSDGQVNGMGGRADPILTTQTFAEAARAHVLRVPTLQDAERQFASRGGRRK